LAALALAFGFVSFADTNADVSYESSFAPKSIVRRIEKITEVNKQKIKTGNPAIKQNNDRIMSEILKKSEH